MRDYVSDAIAALGGVDFLVNNASAFGASDDDKGWAANLAVDMMAIVHATQEAYPALKQVAGQRGEHLLDRRASIPRRASRPTARSRPR